MENKDWGNDERRAPALREGEEIVFSEHGRILNNVCYRAFYHRLVKCQWGGYALLTKHGAGYERFQDYFLERIIPALSVLNSDDRYTMLHAIYDANRDGRRDGIETTARKFKEAFVFGHLKKRKMPKSNVVKVWIEDTSALNQEILKLK